jgi:hypothetical protein
MQLPATLLHAYLFVSTHRDRCQTLPTQQTSQLFRSQPQHANSATSNMPSYAYLPDVAVPVHMYCLCRLQAAACMQSLRCTGLSLMVPSQRLYYLWGNGRTLSLEQLQA